MGADSQAVARWRRRQKKRSVVYKGGECLVCGYSACIWALTFHHIDPSTKEFNIGHPHTRAWPRVKKELDKCALLCNRCHTEVHHGVTDLKSSLKKNPTPQEGDILLEDAESKGLIPPYRPQFSTPKQIYTCKDCGREICGIASIRCKKCDSRFRIGRHTVKIKWPPVDELLGRANAVGYSALGRELGVSDNAIRKRIRTRQKDQEGFGPST